MTRLGRTLPFGLRLLAIAVALAGNAGTTASSPMAARPDVAGHAGGVERDDGEIVSIVSSVDGVAQPARWWAPAGARRSAGRTPGTPVPLVVGLHGWSGDYRNSMGAEYERLARARGWAAIFPNFRGPNKHPGACASDAAVADLLDAVAFARRTASIDGSRIYLLGSSGGGHMALVMASRHPSLWAGVSAWVPITDLAAWHAEVERLEAQHARDLEEICGGPPGAGPRVDAEYRRRSPLFFLSRAAGLPIDLNVGIHDGHRGSVPVSHTLRAFNALAIANGVPLAQLAGADVAWMVDKAEVPPALRATVQDATYEKPVLLRRTAGPVRLTVFDGGHEILREAAFEWLSRQRRAQRR